MISSILFNLWIIPGILLILYWICIGIYRTVWGSEKESSMETKIRTIFPTFWCIIFASIPILNLVLLVGSISTLFIAEERRKYI
jgi:hypothetical protein